MQGGACAEPQPDRRGTERRTEFGGKLQRLVNGRPTESQRGNGDGQSPALHGKTPIDRAIAP